MKTLDDQHVLAKHAQIYPTEEELNCVQKAVQLVEGVLKEVSNAIHQQEMKVYTASLSNKLVARIKLLFSTTVKWDYKISF